MYPLAQNKTMITKELFDEAYQKIFQKSYRSFTRKMLYLILVIIIGGFTFIIGQGLPVFYLFTEIMILGCVFFYITFYLPRTYKKRAYHKMTSGCTGTPWRQYNFYEDHLTVTAPDQASSDIRYEDISSTYKSKKLILLFTKDKRNILIDRTAFTGKVPDFLL